MQPTLASFDTNLIPVIAIVGGISIGLIAVIGGLIKGVFDRKQTEESRREIAAYVAEGSMSPEDAERILAAGQKSRGECG